MDWRREMIEKWLWHAFNGFEESEKQKSTGPTSGYIDQAQLRLLTAHIGHALGAASNSGSINSSLEKHFKEKEGHVNFRDYLEFLHTHTYLEPKDIDLKKLEESCWSLCEKSYDKRVSKTLDAKQVRRVWKLFNFYSETDEYPIVMCREEAKVLMEKLIVGTGNRWVDETFEFKTQGIKRFQFLQVLACFEVNYAKGMDMDRMCVNDSIDGLYDEVIEQCEKKGWMTKRGHALGKAQKRWFVLKKSGMYYYTDKTESQKTQKGCIKLDKDWDAESLPDDAGAKLKYQFMVSTKAQTGKEKNRYDLSCEDPRSRTEWIAAIKEVIRSESKDSIHRTRLQERRQKRQEVQLKEEAEIERKIGDNMNQIKLQELQLENEERRKREEEERKLREKELEELERIKTEIKRLEEEKEKADQQAKDEAAERLASELKQREELLREQEEMENQKRQIDELKELLEEEKRLRELEAKRLAELQTEKEQLELLLAEVERAKMLEEEIRLKQARILEEEAERRRELERLKEEQERELAKEMERRKGLEQQSEELARIQREQAEQLRKEQEKLQQLADERKATDNQLQEAKLKLAEAENRQKEQEAEKKRKEETISRQKLDLEARLSRRLKKNVSPTTKIVTHRGGGAFTESQFDILKEIKAREKQLHASRRKTKLLTGSLEPGGEEDVSNGQNNGVETANGTTTAE